MTAGRCDLLLGHYALPLVVYICGQQAYVRNGDQMLALLQALRDAFLCDGMTELKGRVTAEDLPRGGQYRIWTDWVAQGPGLAPRLVASTICYARQSGTNLTTEMLEFTRLEVSQQLAA